VSRQLRKLGVAALGVAIAALAVLVVSIILGIAGYGPREPERDVSHEKPYSDFIGREYRVTGNISASAWNDYPNRVKILSITLSPSPGTRNRFVSTVTPLAVGQRLRILSARHSYTLLEIIRKYVVAVPGAGLPDGVPVTMTVTSDGTPDPRFYQAIDD
jgi:hypothetical protein